MVFSLAKKALQQQRCAARYQEYSYLHAHVWSIIAERLSIVKRSFSGGRALCVHAPQSAGLLPVLQEVVPEMEGVSMHDAEAALAEAESCSVIVSPLVLHWTNDVGSTIGMYRRALQADGLLIGSLFGEDTLHELRESLVMAEMERRGGPGMHVSPMASLVSVGNALQAGGMQLPTVDRERIRVPFRSAVALMDDLRGMGESNCATLGARMSLGTLLAASAVYDAWKPHNEKDKPGVVATFDLLHFAAWERPQSD